MNTKKTTIWLDFLNFIVIPFYTLTSILSIFNVSKILSIDFMLNIFITLYSIVTFVFLFKRRKISYYLLLGYILIFLGIISYHIYFEINNILYFIIFIIIGIVIWLIPNYIYIRKRKNMFHEHNISHIKKCPGCNRIIPVTMIYCGKCNYKE